MKNRFTIVGAAALVAALALFGASMASQRVGERRREHGQPDGERFTSGHGVRGHYRHLV